MATLPADTLALLYQRPAEILQHLIRFDTTNPPGRERECVLYIRDLLASVGIEATLLARDPDRPNLIARLPGRGEAPPFLLYGHVDVVTAARQRWERQPFGGELADGYVWGRGALDMKGGVAMMVAAFMRAKAERLSPPGDLVLAIVSDEENGGDYGAKWLVEEHADQFRGVRRAIGEFGGFSLRLGGRKFYPIQVAEKQWCEIRVRLRGEGGHGSMPVRGGAMAALGRTLTLLDRKHLPVHVTEPVRDMIRGIAAALPGLQGAALRQLLKPKLTGLLLRGMGDQGAFFDPLLHNTVSPTIVRASDKVNVIPSDVLLHLDGRLLPGLRPNTMLSELRRLLGRGVEIEVVRYDPGPERVDMGLFGALSEILRSADPDGIPVPLVLAGVTDARFFAKLGIQTYGFLPMDLPADFSFTRLIHGANERVPATAIHFGAEAIYRLLHRNWG